MHCIHSPFEKNGTEFQCHCCSTPKELHQEEGCSCNQEGASRCGARSSRCCDIRAGSCPRCHRRWCHRLSQEIIVNTFYYCRNCINKSDPPTHPLSPFGHLLYKTHEVFTKVFWHSWFWTFFLSIFWEFCTLLQHELQKITIFFRQKN